MAQYVGITATGKGIEDTAVAQIHVCVANNGAFISAGIEELALCYVYGVVLGTGGAGMLAKQIDGGAVFVVILVVFLVEGVFSCIAVVGSVWLCSDVGRLTDYTLLATAIDLEAVASLDVDGGAAPNLGVLTIAAAEDAEGRSHLVHTLLVQDYTRVALGNVIFKVCIVIVKRSVVIFLHLGKDQLAVDNVVELVNDDVAVYVTAVITAAIQVAALQTTG